MLIARSRLRYGDHEHQLGLRAVQGAPLNTLGRPCEADHGRAHRVRLGMRNRDLLTEPGRSLRLPPYRRRYELVPIHDLAGPRQQFRHLLNGGLLVPRVEFDLHGPLAEIAGEDLAAGSTALTGCGSLHGLGDALMGYDGRGVRSAFARRRIRSLDSRGSGRTRTGAARCAGPGPRPCPGQEGPSSGDRGKAAPTLTD